MSKFKINVDNMHWTDGKADDPEDLCLHGHAVAIIGDEKLEYDATISATALYLLKSLTQDHIIYKENQMLPCCGFSIIANEELSNVDICGCPNGIDWSVIHEEDYVKLILDNGKEEVIPFRDYQLEVYKFADQVEQFYQSCTPKIMPQDEFDRNGYLAFWNEWYRRRGK